ncbi:hypothetical protein [Trinickia acidisoli]|uniref:hypothetical protein n=1 Tax=Trinickia acidisoli TaxID=2767482 RepID=UPI001A8C1016|nr:hypothetical protein [Trinickia acidisoli]
MPSNFGSKYEAVLVSGIRTMFFYTEIAANVEKTTSFSDATLDKSTYSFGVLQFDVGNNSAARTFLASIGFKDDEIKLLSKQGSIPASVLQGYNDKLKSHESALQDFTDAQIRGYVQKLDSLIDYVKARNPVAADAVLNDPNLQLSLVDYMNQLRLSGMNDKNPPANSMLAYLCGEQVSLAGGKLQIKTAPTVDDIQAFIDDSTFGRRHAKADDTRMKAYNLAIYQIATSPTSVFNTANTAATPAVVLAQAQQQSANAAPALAPASPSRPRM